MNIVSKPSRNHAGFTLFELLIAVSLSTILLSSVAQVLIQQRQGYTNRQAINAMHQQARDAMGFMTRELTMAGYDPAGTGAGIVTATAVTVQFTQDLNQDGDLDDANENVTYTLYDADGDGDQDLGRNTGGGLLRLADNIQALAFTYTLDDDTITPTPTNLNRIRTVNITLISRTAQPDDQYPHNGGYRTAQLTAAVRIRNL